MKRIPIIVLGAGPAGLGAALQLARRGAFEVTILERQDHVGGNAASFDVEGQRVDYGSHRLHPACPPHILEDIRCMLGADLLDRPRHGRIRLRGRWLHFPLKPADLALHVPPGFLVGVAKDTVLKPKRTSADETFATVLERGLGGTICRDFYFPYAEKIWGLPASDLDAEQARRRVSAGSVTQMLRKVLNAVPGFKPQGSGRFFYPRRGFGQISEAYARDAREAGAQIRLGTPVSAVTVDRQRASCVEIRADGGTERLPALQILSTIPLPVLVRSVTPRAPDDVLASSSALNYRAMLLVYLAVETERFTEYDAHYFPAADIAITRLSEPKNYSLSGPPGVTVLCAELPCSLRGAVWSTSDDDLGRLVASALDRAQLPIRSPIRSVVVRRLPHAYPIYTRDYRLHFERLDNWIAEMNGVVTLGRQGLFAHDNTHHTLATAYAAADCIDDQGNFDRTAWAQHRREFESHVVED